MCLISFINHNALSKYARSHACLVLSLLTLHRSKLFAAFGSFCFANNPVRFPTSQSIPRLIFASFAEHPLQSMVLLAMRFRSLCRLSEYLHA
jgi:hypothetical protein